MKNSIHTKAICLGCAIAMLGSSCATMDRPTRTAVATQTGAIVGGTFGSAIGDQMGGYNGSFWGSMLGSVAGIAVGAAIASAPNNQEAKQQISRIEMKPAPAIVIKDIILKDENGNQTIDAGEKCQISFIIINNGDAVAHQVIPYIKTHGNAKKIKLSAPVSIQQISTEDEISYTVQARASEKLKTGTAEFEVTLVDGADNELCGEQFSIPTQGLSKR